MSEFQHREYSEFWGVDPTKHTPKTMEQVRCQQQVSNKSAIGHEALNTVHKWNTFVVFLAKKVPPRAS